MWKAPDSGNSAEESFSRKKKQRMRKMRKKKKGKRGKKRAKKRAKRNGKWMWKWMWWSWCSRFSVACGSFTLRREETHSFKSCRSLPFHFVPCHRTSSHVTFRSMFPGFFRQTPGSGGYRKVRRKSGQRPNPRPEQYIPSLQSAVSRHFLQRSIRRNARFRHRKPLPCG